MKHFLALMLAAITTPALAQTSPVVLACTIEQTQVSGYPVGLTIHYRIETDRFRPWDTQRGEWFGDLCRSIDYVRNSSCTHSPLRFQAVASEGAVIVTVSIDRTTGEFRRHARIFAIGDHPGSEQVTTGRCRPSEPPRPAATQF